MEEGDVGGRGALCSTKGLTAWVCFCAASTARPWEPRIAAHGRLLRKPSAGTVEGSAARLASADEEKCPNHVSVHRVCKEGTRKK